jgi:hypothetical protein
VSGPVQCRTLFAQHSDGCVAQRPAESPAQGSGLPFTRRRRLRRRKGRQPPPGRRDAPAGRRRGMRVTALRFEYSGSSPKNSILAKMEGSIIMNFRLSLAGRGMNTIRLFVMVCFIFGIISLINTCTTTQQPRSAKSFTTEHRASASTIASQAQAYEPEVPVKVREWISSALASPDLVLPPVCPAPSPVLACRA